MLAFRTGEGALNLDEVAPYLLEQARVRKGQWRVTVYEKRTDREIRGLQAHEVVFTEEEYSKLSRTLYHGLRNGTKLSALHAGLENAAQTLWPTGSLDHVAMRHVGVAVVMRYITKAAGIQPERGVMRTIGITGLAAAVALPWLKTRWNRALLYRWCAAIAALSGAAIWLSGVRRRLPKLTRVEPPEKDKKSIEDKGKGDEPPPPPPPTPGPSGSPPAPAAGAAATLAQPPAPPANNNTPAAGPTPPTLDTPSTFDDDRNGAEAAEDGRTVVRGEVVAVLGQNFDKTEPVNHIPVVGLMVGPCQQKPNVYAKTASNIKAAINERITKKAQAPNLSKADKERIGSVVRKSMMNGKTGVFSKARVQEWACKHFDLEEIRSGKWSLERFRGAIGNLYAKEHPSYSFKADIKCECMPEGKAPRMLIADGDEGQLMALAVVKCFEELLFEHFEKRSIKHAAKKDAMDRVVQELKKKGAKAVEGDGSAWDTTCNVLIRSLIENPVLRRIFEILAEYGVIPSTWMEEHSKACEQKKLRLFFSNKFESMSATIDAIRRSGHRGTSCLNWWVNFVMWVCSVFKEPARFLDVNVRKGVDLTGVIRWWNGCFEGDDSLCTMSPPMVEGDKLSEVFLKFWKDGGFNMKIVFCSTRATFVGWHIGCVDGELTDFRCPELPRALANSGVSVSTEAVKVAKSECRKAANVLAAASALARAADFSGILPSVSNKYLEYAESVTTSDFHDREMSIRATGEDGIGAGTIRGMIKERNIGVSPQDELEVLAALGVSATSDEIATFQEYVWSMDPHVLTDYDSFRESLPPSWRTL